MLRKMFFIGVVISIFILSSCIKPVEKYPLIDSKKNFSWVNFDANNDMNRIFTLDDNSYYVVTNADIKYINTDGTIEWTRDYWNINVSSVSKDSKNMTFSYYGSEGNNFFRKIITLNKEGNVVWECGPYNQVDYLDKEDLYIITKQDNTKELSKLRADGTFEYSVPIHHFIQSIGDNQIVLVRDQLKYYVANYLNGVEIWRKGPCLTYYWVSIINDNKIVYLNSDNGFMRFYIVDLAGNLIAESGDYVNIDPNIEMDSLGNIYYAYDDNNRSYITKVDADLNTLWVSPGYYQYAYNFKVYNDELYYTGKKADESEFVFAKVNKENNLVFEKNFEEIAISHINTQGVVLNGYVNSKQTIYKYDFQGNQLFSYSSDDVIKIIDNEDNYYFISTGNSEDDNYYIYLFNNETKVYERGPLPYATAIYMLPGNDILYSYYNVVNEQMKFFISIVDKNGKTIIDHEIIGIELIDYNTNKIYVNVNNTVKELTLTKPTN